MADLNIKKVKECIYEFDLSKCELVDGNEMIVTNGISEFTMAFRKNDLDNGIIVTPQGYSRGLIYKSSGGGSFYNNPKWAPDKILFRFNLLGLKKNVFYKLTVSCKDAGPDIKYITDDRSLTVTTDANEVVIDDSPIGLTEYKEYYGIFRSYSNEVNLLFSIGKISINNIRIDEIELNDEEDEEDDTSKIADLKFDAGKTKIAALGMFSCSPKEIDTYLGRYIALVKFAGQGLNLYYDKDNNDYLLERDNAVETLVDSFLNINYIIDINTNKMVNSSRYVIEEISQEISPNTFKPGYIRFAFVDKNDNKIRCPDTAGRLVITVTKIF